MLNMDRLKARLLRGGVLESLGLEQLLDEKLKTLKQRILANPLAAKIVAPVSSASAKATSAVKSAAKSAAKAEAKPKKRTRKVAATPLPSVDALAQLLAALETHPQKEVLLRAGQQKDQLLRSLVPLYLAPEAPFEITSGVISAFWKQQGVNYAAPNAAKALREHVGYARATKLGKQITPHGMEYVNAAITTLSA